MTPVSARSRPTRFRFIALAFALFLGLGVALAAVVHDRYVAYEPVAARHVPPGATAAVRFDLTHVSLYAPYRRFIAPLADRLPSSAPSQDRIARLEARGVRVMGDVRELVAAFGPASGDWVAVIGGRLPRSGLAETLAAVLREEGKQVQQDHGIFAVAEPAFFFAQSEDSALVLASTEERLRSALPTTPPVEVLSTGAGGVLLTGGTVPKPVESVRGSFHAGSTLAFDVEVAFHPESSAALRRQALERLQEQLSGGNPAVSAALTGATRDAPETTTQISVRLPREAVEALADRAAAAIVRR